jgi:hypothetical protein
MCEVTKGELPPCEEMLLLSCVKLSMEKHLQDGGIACASPCFCNDHFIL